MTRDTFAGSSGHENGQLDTTFKIYRFGECEDGACYGWWAMSAGEDVAQMRAPQRVMAAVSIELAALLSMARVCG